jgi:hypothetical protein
MPQHPCGNCEPGQEATCGCPCHGMSDEMQEVMILAFQEAMAQRHAMLAKAPVTLGTITSLTQLCHPGSELVMPGTPWPCKPPIILGLTTRRMRKLLGETFWN